MIKLKKNPSAPASLSSQKCKDALKTIRRKKKKGEKVTADDFGSLYKQQDVKDQLKIDQNDKCAYCETTLKNRQRHVEHYRPKSIYWEKAFDWNNLLGCCSACNSTKGYQFPMHNRTPLLINPYIDDPADYIAFHEEIATPKNGLSGVKKQKAETTIELLLSRDDLVFQRRKEWAAYRKLIEYHNRLIELIGYDDIGLDDFALAEHVFAGMFRYQQ